MNDGGNALNLDLSKAAIGGASSGANLAAAVTQRVSSRTDVLSKIRFKIQLLVVPVVDNTSTVETSPSYREYEYTPSLSARKMLWYRSLYLPDVERRSESEASPLLFNDFSKLPPAVILVGELDVVRHEGEEYGRKLREAGVMAKVEVMRGMPHPFLALDGVLDQGKRAVKIICDSLRHATT
jgi:acetyl esterase/lipase